MKIIEPGVVEKTWPRRFTCPSCKAVLELDLADIHRNADYQGSFESWFIDCPCCAEQPDVPKDWWSTVDRLKREAVT